MPRADRQPRRRPFAAVVAATAAVLALATALGLPRLAAAETLPPSQEGVYVYDIADIWSPAAEAQAQAIATSIRERTQAQIAVVSWPSDIGNVSTEEARADAITIMDAWGVGREGVNDGLVVLFDMDSGSRRHGQIYLYSGSGFMDKYLTPDEAAEVVNGDMLPKAADGDLDGALLAGLGKVDHVVQPNGNPDRWLQGLLNLGLMGLLLGGGLLVFGLFLRTWWVRGRDAEMPLIDDSVLLPTPPLGLTPALATVLRNDGVDREGFTSALVDLGHRGLVTFEQPDGDKKHVDLVIPPSPLIDPNSLEARRRPLGTAEAELAGSIERKAQGDRVLRWSELKAGEGAKLYESFKKDLGRAAKASGWYRDDPNKLTSKWAGIGIVLVFAAIGFGFLFVFDLSDESSNLIRPGRAFMGLAIAAVVALGVIIALLSGRLAARTVDGARTLAMALAYRNTLRHEIKASQSVDQAVERTHSRLPWITTPDLLTVWAVAFGLRDEIDDLIRATFETARSTGAAVWSPVWYAGSDGFDSVANLSGMIGSIGTTASSSSGSGYGGGSSGGGGGAGGGF